MENPHEHMMNFLEYCNTLKQNDVSPEAIRMQLFPFSLSGNAKMWFHALPFHIIDTWEHCYLVMAPRKLAAGAKLM
jgi:hypothetical protein